LHQDIQVNGVLGRIIVILIASGLVEWYLDHSQGFASYTIRLEEQTSAMLRYFLVFIRLFNDKIKP